MWNKKIPIVLICDDNFLVPAGVTISSIISSKNSDTCYDIYIVCASLSEESEAIFSTFASDTVLVHIIREDVNKFAYLHINYSYSTCAAPPVALLKFALPDIFTNYDKILYLDVDILVRIDLTELYNIELGDNLLAAVMTSSAAYNPFYQFIPDYFNSGVMLLNLKQMRKENTKSSLIKTKMECKVTNLMDQHTYNYVCTGRVKLLPIKYNLLAVILDKERDKWTIELLNQLYGTNYRSQEELLKDGAIIHFASKDKPWKNPSVIYANEWLAIYRSTEVLHTISGFYLDMLSEYAQRVYENQINTKIVKRVENYISGRIDIKLTGNDADFELKYISDNQARVTIPQWLQKNGKGYVIESCEGKLELVFKANTAGKINIYLRGKDVRDIDGIKRVPYWINYNMLTYNDITELIDNTYAWHDKPIIISHEVKTGETIHLHIEWLPGKVEDPELPKKLKASLSREASLKKSGSFRIGRAITWFPRKVRGGARCLNEHGIVYTVKKFFCHIIH